MSAAGARRGGFNLIELLLVVAIVAALVGIAAPFLEGALREAGRSKLDAQFEVVHRALDRAARELDANRPFVPGSPVSPVHAFAPDGEVALEALVPRYLPEVPRDPWGNEIYRFGRFLVSNGPEGVPRPDGLVFRALATLPAYRDPEDDRVVHDREHHNASYQASVIAHRVHRYELEHGAPPIDLVELFARTGEASPPDPWGNPFELEGDEVVSPGADGIPGTGDDVGYRWDPFAEDPARFEESFARGIALRLLRLHPPPRGKGGGLASFPLDVDPAARELRISHLDGGRGVGYWVRPLHFHLPDPESPFYAVSLIGDLEVREGVVELGVFGSQGEGGRGLHASVRIADEARRVARIRLGVPGPGREHLTPPTERGTPQALPVTYSGTLLEMRVQNYRRKGPPGWTLRLAGTATGGGVTAGESSGRAKLPPAGNYGFSVRALTQDTRFTLVVKGLHFMPLPQ